MSGYIGQQLGIGQQQVFTYVCTAGQTSFSGVDSNSYVLNYTVGFVDAFLNGRRLTPGLDYTATDGSSLTLLAAANASDVLFVSALSQFSTANWVTNAVNYVYTATAGQTSFSGLDSNNQTLSYVNGTILVSVNGLQLPQSDYTATNGSTVILNSGINAGDIVQIFSLRTMNPVNIFTQTQSDARYLQLTGGTLTTNNLTVGTSSYFVSNGNVGIANTSPANKLAITGDIYVANSSGNRTFYLDTGGSITLTGGRTTPSTGGTILSYNGINNDFTANGRNAPMTGGWATMRINMGPTYDGFYIVGDNSQTSAYMQIQSCSSNTFTTQMIFNSSGNMGLGTASPSNVKIHVTANNTIGGAAYCDFLRATNSGGTNPNKTFRLNSTGGVEIINSAYTNTIFSLSDSGINMIGGGQASGSSSNDGTSNYLAFNNNGSQIYDDGNMHIHSRASGQGMWINTNGGAINFGNQIPVSGGAVATGITMGSSSTLKAYLSVYGSKSYSIGSYGYLATGGSGTGSSTTANFSIYCDNRMNAVEFDATSDERLKDIQGTIPLDNAINFIKNVNGLYYTWKPGFGDEGLKSGFGAQSLHKAGFDHMVSGIENDKVEGKVDDDGWVHPDKLQLTVNYNEAIPYHHEVIKNLLERIEQLESKIKDLENK
jgi:hypothetical protein